MSPPSNIKGSGNLNVESENANSLSKDTSDKGEDV